MMGPGQTADFVQTLASKLVEFSQTISPDERDVLARIVRDGLDPLDRALLQDGERPLLNAGEESLLRALAARAGKT